MDFTAFEVSESAVSLGEAKGFNFRAQGNLHGETEQGPRILARAVCHAVDNARVLEELIIACVLIWWSEFQKGGRTFRSDNSQDFTRGL
jgi:hypothetical protein